MLAQGRRVIFLSVAAHLGGMPARKNAVGQLLALRLGLLHYDFIENIFAFD
jgi:hypothetical protein